MKKTLLILAALLCGCFALKAQNFNFSAPCPSGQTLYYRITDAVQHWVKIVAPKYNNEYGWNGHTRPTGQIVLPETIEDNGTSYTVTAIGDYAFYHCNGLAGSLTIPNSVTIIGESAFEGCTGFTGKLIIGNSVTSIGNRAFEDCLSFTGSLTIPNLVTNIGDYAFYGCSGFTGSLTIGNSVTSIEDFAFCHCTGFTGSLIIGNSLHWIGSWALDYTYFTQIIAKPASPPLMGNGKFYNMFNLQTIIVPCGTIDAYKNLWSDFASKIRGGTFQYDLTVTSANPKLCMADITQYSDCSYGLSTVTATPAENVTFIGWTENGNLVSTANPYNFTLTSDRNLVADFRFSTPDGLIYKITSENPPTVALMGHTEGFTIHDFVIPSTVSCESTTYSVTSIGNYAFYDYPDISGSLTIPNSVTSIGDYAFYDCSDLTGSLNIPNSVTSIGNWAFYNCTGLTGSLNIGNAVTSIGNYAFGLCPLTGSLNIPNSVTRIGDYAFQYCSHFSGSLNIGNSVTDIGICAFENCSGFTGSLTIPNSVISIRNYAFQGCTRFTDSLTIGASVLSIGINAFINTQFTHIIAKPTTPPVLDTDAFYGLTELQSITVPCGKDIDYRGSWNPDITNKIVDGFVYELTVASSNPDFGTAKVTQPATCDDTQATVTAVPAPNATFTGWTEDGEVVSTDTTYTFNQNSDRHLVANFTGYTYVYAPIMSLPYPIDPVKVYVLGYQVGNDYYLHTSGTTAGEMQLSKNPENPVEYKFTNFGLGVSVHSGVTHDTFLHIDTQGVSYGLFNPMEITDPFALSIVNGDISSVAASGYTVCHDGNIITTHTGTSEGNLRFFTFANKPLYHVAVSANPEGAGTPTATMDGEPVESAPEGTVITVTAEPVDGYKFVNWTENGEVVSIANPYTFTLENNTNLVANFVRPNYDFSSSSTGVTLYYRIIDMVRCWVSIVAPNSDNFSICYSGYDKPIGEICIPETVIHNGKSYIVKAIATNAFYECNGLTGSLNIPNSVTSIGEQAFCRCSGFNGTLTIGSSMTSIGKSVFDGCKGFTGSLTIPNSVTSIGIRAFYNCSGFNGSLTIGDHVESIGDYAFYNCSGFNGSLTIPNSVTLIDRHAFYGCSGFIGSLTIGSSVETIGYDAFYSCNFTNIISKAQTAPNLASSGIPDASNKVYIPTGTLQSYQNHYGNWYILQYNLIEQDRETCTFNGNSNIAWSDASNWEGNAQPTKKCPNVFINADCQMDADAEVGLVTVAAGKTLTVDTPKTLKPDGVILENGAQLVNNGTVTSNSLIMKKDIAGYGESAGSWNLVSSPVGKIGIPSSMKANPEENYDLYRFSQTGDSEGREWLNYKAGAFLMENQSGYLYANKNNTTIVFSGGFADTGAKTLEYVEDVDFPGFNLVGNPFPCNATISGENLRSSNYFYKMNALGTNLEVVENPVLAPCTGVFAVAANSDATVTFAQTSATANVTRGEKSSLQDIRVELLANGKTIDRAFLNMNGESLPKFSLQDNNSEICFYQNKEKLAVASTDAAHSEMPLNFKAAKNGTYTISVNTENVEAEYLHLIDNLTGNDVDLLGSEGDVARNVSTYTFDAKTSDYASRFKLVFCMTDTSTGSVSDSFAYISNGEIVISNEGRATLQVIDVLGRIVSSEEINGDCRISTNTLTAGLYILNLDGMTQKIVVE